MLNILTRTNNRPKYFFSYNESVKNQDYQGTIKQFVSIDDEKNMEYVSMYRNNVETVSVFRKQRLQANEFPYNEYLNELLKKVENGWVMVLDDDDKFMKNDAASIILENATRHGEDSLLLWKVKIGPRICPSVGSFGKTIRRNDISNIGFAFHTKHKDKAHWPSVRGGDSMCIKTLSEHLNVVWIDEVLTCTNNNSGNFGNQRDIILNNEETELYNSFRDKHNKHIEKLQIDNYIKEEPTVIDAEKEESIIEYQRDEDTVTSFEDILKNYKGEKLYILKESSIKCIAEMLSSAMNSKQIYEDILNEKYLINKSISTNKQNIQEPNGPKEKKEQKDHKAPKEKEETIKNTGSEYSAKNILQKLEDEEKQRVESMMKKSEMMLAFDSSNSNEHDDCIDGIIVLVMEQSSNKTLLLNYLVNCDFSKEKISFITCKDSIDFNSNGLIEAAKKAVENNYRKVIVITENSLVIKTLTKELQILSRYQEYSDSDIIFCGLGVPFGKLSVNNQTRTTARNRQKKKPQSMSTFTEFDPDYYCMLYDDLRSSDVNTPEKAQKHWEKYGYDENRIGKRQLIPLEKSTPINEFNGVILSKNACINISECFDESLVSIMLLKEFSKTSYIECPYLFETLYTLKTRQVNYGLYNHRYIE